MKKILIVLAVFITLSSAQCNKDKAPLDQLPPETQTGAGTFGCLVNGEVFKPKGTGLTTVLTSYYQFVYPGTNGYYFQLAAHRNESNCKSTQIVFNLDSLVITQGDKMSFSEPGRGKAGAEYWINQGCTIPTDEYKTSVNHSGEIFFKKFDEVNRIASGTFWFEVFDKNGNIIKVTDGRFDLKFTR